MELAVLTPLVVGVCGYGARMACLWMRARTAVRLAEIHEAAFTDQLRSLPAGARLWKMNHGQSDFGVELADGPARQGDRSRG